MHVQLYACSLRIHVSMHVYAHTSIHVCIRALVHLCIHACVDLSCVGLSCEFVALCDVHSYVST